MTCKCCRDEDRQTAQVRGVELCDECGAYVRTLLDALARLTVELTVCRGTNPLSANPADWGHAAMIAGLVEQRDQADASLRQVIHARDALQAELARVVAVLPDPVWNERRVLVWSAADVERIRTLLSSGGDPQP